MIPIKQTLFNIEEGAEDAGNCFVAALASILEVDLDSIPHFCKIYSGKTEWFVAARRWLRYNYGLDLLPLNYENETDDERRKIRIYLKGYHIASVKSPREVMHSVVIKDGVIVHDPSPNNDALGLPILEVLAFVLLDASDYVKKKERINAFSQS